MMKNVGFWSGGSGENSDFPDVNALVDPTWDSSERETVLEYLAAGEVTAQYRGFSLCRICRTINGTQDHGDGTWTWPQGFAHYLREHDVKPPQEFIDYVLAKSM